MVAQAKAAVAVETANFDEGEAEGGIGFKLFSQEAFSLIGEIWWLADW